MFNDFELKIDSAEDWELKYLHVYHGIYVADSENEYKKGNKLSLIDPSFEIKEEANKYGNKYFVLVIKSKDHTVSVRANEKISLEYIIYNSEQKNERDMGRPMTFVPHLVNVESVLDKRRIDKFHFKGIINLVVVALIFSHIRLIYDSFMKTGLLLNPKSEVAAFLTTDNLKYLGVSASVILSSIAICFSLEKAAPILKNENLILLMHVFNFGFLLFCPVILHSLGLYNPALGCFVLTLVTMIFLKLFSYVHFWNDVRKFIYKKNKLQATPKKEKAEDSSGELIAKDVVIESTDKLKSSMYAEIESIINNYPGNVKLNELILFFFMPVLCFQYKFPRTERIRKSKILNYGSKIIICIFLQ